MDKILSARVKMDMSSVRAVDLSSSYCFPVRRIDCSDLRIHCNLCLHYCL